MAETFINFLTKGIEFEKDGDRRLFSGHITAEVVDHQNDFIFVSEVMKIIDKYMAVLPCVSEVHTNRMIGKSLGYEQSEIDGHASVKVYMEIFKQEGVELYDQVWKKIKSGEYSGLSMGGGSKKREPMFKDGRMVMKLSDLELYEIAVCPSPANPLAIIDKYNEFAKSEVLEKKQHNIDGRSVIQCSSIGCEFGKAEPNVDEGKADVGTNIDEDIDIDNKKKPGEITNNENKVIKTGAGGGATSGNMEELGDDSRVPQPGQVEVKVHEHESGDSKDNNSLPDSGKDVKKQEVPQKQVDEAGKDLEQFDKPKPQLKEPEGQTTVANSGHRSTYSDANKDKPIQKDHIPGMPEKQEYKTDEEKRKEADKIGTVEKSEFEPILLEYLKVMDAEVEKKDKTILKLKNRIVEITQI